MPSGVFSGGTLSSFQSAMNLCLLRTYLHFLYLYFSLFLQFYSLLGIMILGRSGLRDIRFSSSMCQVILTLIIILNLPLYSLKTISVHLMMTFFYKNNVFFVTYCIFFV